MARPQFVTERVRQAAFVLRAVLWGLGLFALMRLTWAEQSLLAALVRLQDTIVRWYVANGASAITITPSCSASDVIAMCLGVILAFPASWRQRVTGAVLGVAFIIALNVVRLATLAVLATSWPEAFQTAHVLVWPVLLTAGTAAYVWRWMQKIRPPEAARANEAVAAVGARARRFAWCSAGLLALHLAVAPWTMTSTTMLSAGRWTAKTAEVTLRTAGIGAQADDRLLVTRNGAFEITPECLLTPVFALYLAGVFSLPIRRRLRAAALAAALPAFFVLGVLRVLVLALPGAAVSSPLFLVHGFFQLVFGVAVVAVACRIDGVDRTTLVPWARFFSALIVGTAAGLCGGWVMTPALGWLATVIQPFVPHMLTSLRVSGDPQGALVLMPAFQIGLLCALWIATAPRPAFRALVLALAGAVLAQLALLIAAGAWFAHAGALPHALVLRAAIVSVPVALALLLFVRRGGERVDSPQYRRFWQEVGDNFPDLAGAASTRFYSDNERRLIGGHLRPGDRVLKTDLWDEAKNTRILQWTAAQGADVYGIDLSSPIVRHARREFAGTPAGLAQADVRRLPFADGSFDVVYSMGTVEHFEETQAAVGELARVLRPGGRLILGVPNRHDPFLRPLLVAALYALGLYDYGFEKSYSRARLKQMLETAGLAVREETGILFIPGWLRMLDLLGHTRFRPVTWFTRPGVAMFVWLDRRVPRLRRYGYLLASIGVKR